ncbi:MAG: hypothetical protein PWR10_654 [Halanaerobiales bacterium]|nr:hypothetical protein [Halanaerobiales bacterium]
MRVTIYGADIELEKANYENIGDVIDAIEVAGFVVTEVIADGENITGFTEEELEKIKPIEELKIISKNVKDLTRDTLVEAENYILQFISGVEEIINKFNQGREAESFKLLSQGLEGLEWLNTLLGSLISMGEVDSTKEFINNWQGTMEELLDAMERQDIVLLNDILEYELVPVLEDYLELVKEVKEQSEPEN